ncbi:MAG: PCMD domain-containing protein [Alistipes sp.]|nr:PCMD domain-containing protein [Alistipes sp.]
MKRLNIYILTFFMTMLVGLGGCIKNDLPYPVVPLYITSLEADGLVGEPVIDEVRKRVTLNLAETTDIQNVNIRSVGYTDKTTASVDVVGTHDLRTPIEVVLSLYQDYIWHIEAKQTIERRFTVEGQIGDTEWDLDKRIATAYVGFENRSNVKVTSLKLAADGISTYEWADGIDSGNFNTVRYVYVTCHGRTERWSLYVKTTDVVVDITKADGWGRLIWLYGQGVSDTNLGFRYRKSGDTEWREVPNVEVDGGSFKAKVTGLDVLTEYEVIAYSDDNTSPVYRVKTEDILQLQNGGFEEWATIRKIVCPYLSEDAAYWGTGNPGAATVGATVTDKSTDIRPGSSGKYSARLESIFANVAGIGKFAAGNLFLGKYVGTVGTNGIVGFGRQFNARPTALRLWMKYNCGNVDRIGSLPSGSTLKIGDPDTGSIYIALGTWSAAEYGVDADGVVQGTVDSPVIIDTRDRATFFDSSSPAVVAYGELMLNESVSEWTQITIPLNYTTTSVVPTNIIIVCSASRLGDYFTGSTESVMLLDDMELLYE